MLKLTRRYATLLKLTNADLDYYSHYIKNIKTIPLELSDVIDEFQDEIFDALLKKFYSSLYAHLETGEQSGNEKTHNC